MSTADLALADGTESSLKFWPADNDSSPTELSIKPDIRFGGKRRQCVACKKTWRVHPARRGRKAVRWQAVYLRRVLNHGLAVRQLAWHSRLPLDSIYKRFAKNLNRLVKQRRYPRVRGDKLILLIDAEWQYFRGRLWTLYLVAVKSVGSQAAAVLDPVLRPDKENAGDWSEVLDALPPAIKSRVVAVVSDGVRGMENIALRRRWTLQRCHFHLLSLLQKMRGKRATTVGRITREEIYLLVKSALAETDANNLRRLCRRLAVLATKSECPKRMRMMVRDFLRRLPEFRSYLDHPELRLPTTVNVMESVNSFIRRKVRTVNLPNAWRKWATACVRFKPKFTCK